MAKGGCKRAEKIGNRYEIALAGCMPGNQDYLRRVITARCERETAVGRPGESITASGHKISRCRMRANGYIHRYVLYYTISRCGTYKECPHTHTHPGNLLVGEPARIFFEQIEFTGS